MMWYNLCGGSAMRKTEAFARRLIKQFTKRFSIVMKSGALKGMRIVAVAGPKFQHDRYEPEFFRAFIENLKEGMVVYDVGAHWGYYTLVASRVVGDTGRVIAFEPNHENIQILRRNIQYNNIKNIECLEIAVGDLCGKVSFDPGADTGLGKISTAGKIQVECRTLDSLMDSLSKPQLIKIDVEGAEAAVIRGASRLIAEIRPVLFIEMHGAQEFAECHQILSLQGYSLVELQGKQRVMYRP
jgi:FkbM family methyltransferase